MQGTNKAQDDDGIPDEVGAVIEFLLYGWYDYLHPVHRQHTP